MNTEKVDQIKESLGKQNIETVDRLDKLWAKMDEGNYMNQGYRDGTEVTISGDLFQNFINNVANTKVYLNSLRQHAEMIITSIDSALLEQNKLTIHLMEQHIKNVDLGVTVPSEELDKEDAKVKIQPKQNGKRK